jgi:hypothetical protein
LEYVKGREIMGDLDVDGRVIKKKVVRVDWIQHDQGRAQWRALVERQ